jgi:hypothetical protein
LPEIQPKNYAGKLYMMQEATLTAIYFLIKIKLKNLMLQKMNTGEIRRFLHKLSILVTSSMYQPETPKRIVGFKLLESISKIRRKTELIRIKLTK